jgi:hypothetical protein
VLTQSKNGAISVSGRGIRERLKAIPILDVCARVTSVPVAVCVSVPVSGPASECITVSAADVYAESWHVDTGTSRFNLCSVEPSSKISTVGVRCEADITVPDLFPRM